MTPESHGLDPQADAAGETPQLHVDSDWKAQAQAEKEKLAQAEAKAKAESGERPQGELPPPNFRGLVGMLASQAMMGLGTMQDPQTGGVVVDLEGSKFAIDLLGMLEEKTAGNLTQEEGDELGQALNALRSHFVQISKLVAQQMAEGNVSTTGGMPGGAPGVMPGGPAGGGAGASPIIDPSA